MRLEIRGDRKIIRSAWYSKLTEQTAVIVINTHERYVFPEAYGSCGGYKDDTVDIKAYLNIEYGDDFEESVHLEAETEDERGILSRSRFQRHCKDQLEILLISEDLL